MMRNVLRALVLILPVLPVAVMPVAVVAQPQPTLPPGLITETTCVPGHGYPAYRPQDLPFGPFYGLWERRLIYTEYRVTPDEVQGGKLTNVKSLTGPMDHVDIEWHPRGHPGYEVPHYDVYVWNIPHEEHMRIRCP